jgi:hypothetical protein
MPDMKHVVLCILGIVFIAGCTTFTHPVKKPGEFDRDRRYCEQYVAEHPGDAATCTRASVTCVTCEDVKRCLEEQKGWKRVRN